MTERREGSRFAVVGYASEDHKFSTGPFQGRGRTTLVRPEAAPVREPGGIYYFARCLRRHDAITSVVSWLGDDEIGERYLTVLRDLGAQTRGVRNAGRRSPSTHMFYDSSGVVSFYDPGDVDFVVTEPQRREINAAEVVIASVAPPEAMQDLLDEVRPDGWMTWAVKADPAAITSALAAELATRANMICLSNEEREFLTGHCGLDLTEVSRRGTLVMITRGAEGATCLLDGDEYAMPAPDRRDVGNPTGAGDTFATSLTHALAQSTECGLISVKTAVTHAARDAADLLSEREKGLRHVH